VFYKYTPWILALLGATFGLVAYFLDVVCRIKYESLLWLGVILILFCTGFVTGRLIQRLKLSSHTDFLTGLWNRRYFYLRLDEEESRATRKKTPLCVAMVDVDGFKTVNDTYGHAIGDVLLSDLAAILKKNTRKMDVVSRWGGDEFAIIFPETSLDTALDVMKRVRDKVEASFKPYSLTISAGIISLEPDQDIKSLLIKADQALYKAKNKKNSVIAVIDR
jgi:diguanylate cyclase (GGDEF)-like protein